MDSCRVSSRAAAPCSSRYDSRAAISMLDRRRFGIGTLLYFANSVVAIGSPSARTVPVPAQHVATARQPQLLGDELDIGLVAGEKQPAGPDVELLGVSLQRLGRITLGIDRDRVEEDVLANAVAEKLLHLNEPCRLERALVLAAGVDEVDRYLPALEQIVVETKGRPVLGNQRYVR